MSLSQSIDAMLVRANYIQELVTMLSHADGFTDEQRDLVAARGEEIGQFGAEPACGKVRQPAHVVQRFVRRPGGDNAIHAVKIGRRMRELNNKVTKQRSRLGWVLNA